MRPDVNATKERSEANWRRSKWWDPIIVACEPIAQEPNDPWGDWRPGAHPPERDDSDPDAHARETTPMDALSTCGNVLGRPSLVLSTDT